MKVANFAVLSFHNYYCSLLCLLMNIVVCIVQAVILYVFKAFLKV